jgi:hypothetical protein
VQKKTLGARLIITFALGVAATGCARGNRPPPADDGLAVLELALGQVPADLRCAVITVSAGAREVRKIDVQDGTDPSTVLRRLPVGLVVLSIDAYASGCAAVTEDSAPTWIGGPVSVTLRSGPNDPLTIAMRRAGQVRVTLDFDGGTSDGPVAVGSACVSDPDCAPNRCVHPLADPAAAGTCQPAPVEGVGLRLAGGQAYLFYSPSGGPGCDPNTGNIFTVDVIPGADACVPAELDGSYAAVPVEALAVCSPGQDCRPCTDDSCLPASCFQPLPPPDSATCTTRALPALDGAITRYVLFPKVTTQPPPPPREGLPMVLSARAESNLPLGQASVVITPPADHPAFVYGHLVPQAGSPESSHEECGEPRSMCGVLPLFAVKGFTFSSFHVVQTDQTSGLGFWGLQ